MVISAMLATNLLMMVLTEKEGYLAIITPLKILTAVHINGGFHGNGRL